MENKLKRCPFCMGEAELYESCGMAIIECKRCHTHSKGYSSHAAAIEAWNTRSDYAVQAENERKAELGSRTCEWVLEHSGTLYDKWRCSECSYLYVDSRTDGGATELDPNFCPNCGCKVVDEC